MKSQTDRTIKSSVQKVLLALLLFMSCSAVHAQFVTNPLEYVAHGTGNAMINDTVKSEMKAQEKTALLQNSMAAQYTMIRGWQNKYNNYLKDVSGFASQLKACTQLYSEGVRCFFNLYDLGKAVGDNPGGIVANLSMSTLYMETALELVTIYNYLNDAIAKGNKENMLTGAERAEILWELEDKMNSLNGKLTLLQRSVRIYTLTDMWNHATAGMIDKDHKAIAQEALARWKRVPAAILD